MTQNDESTHQNGHKHPDQNRWTRHQELLLHSKYCDDHIVTTPNQLGGTHGRAPTLESLVQKTTLALCVRTYMLIAWTRLQSWWHGQQLQYGKKNADNNTHRITNPPKRKSINTGNTGRSTWHAPGALWRPHRDHPKPTWWQTFARSNA